MKKNYLEKNIEKKCAVCGGNYMTSELDLYPCPHCGWYNDLMCEEHENEVVYRNLISFNKAKELHAEGKPLKPNLNDFLKGLYFYSEMQFYYKGKGYGLFLTSHDSNKDVIDFFEFDCDSIGIYDTKEDFIANAKIGDEYVRDIWDKVGNPSYM